MRKLLLSAMFMLVPGVAYAVPGHVDWGSINTLRCTFTDGATFDGKKIATTEKPFGDDPMLIIDSINLRLQAARMIGNAGVVDVNIMDAGDTLTLVDRMQAGNWAFTSVLSGKDDKFYITTSRHVALSGQPVFSQSYGTCKIWN